MSPLPSYCKEARLPADPRGVVTPEPCLHPMRLCDHAVQGSGQASAECSQCHPAGEGVLAGKKSFEGSYEQGEQVCLC